MVSATNYTRTMPGSRNFNYGNFDTYTTVADTDAAVGTIECWGMTKKRLQLAVTTKDLTITLKGYLDPACATTPLLIGTFTVTAGQTHAILIEAMYAAIVAYVKPASAGQNGTITISYFSDNTEHRPIRCAFATESITVTNAAAIGLTRATMDSALQVLITIESNPVRFWTDGTTPTTTSGHYLSSGDSLLLDNTIDAMNLLMIGTVGSATARVTYSR